VGRCNSKGGIQVPIIRGVRCPLYGGQVPIIGGFASRAESTWFPRLKLKCDVLDSRFTFSVKLRRCTKGSGDGGKAANGKKSFFRITVGGCRLNPLLNAPACRAWN
jgi:hypothetical protein